MRRTAATRQFSATLTQSPIKSRISRGVQEAVERPPRPSTARVAGRMQRRGSRDGKQRTAPAPTAPPEYPVKGYKQHTMPLTILMIIVRVLSGSKHEGEQVEQGANYSHCVEREACYSPLVFTRSS